MWSRLLVSALIIAAVLPGSAFSQEKAPAEVDTAENPVEAAPPREKAKSVNVDMKAIYGQYNNMQSSINLSHEQEDYVYLLSTDFKRSNDFGYNRRVFENTSYYENRIGGTGNININDTDKLLVDIEINDDSRGMFDNPVYSREEKDKSRLSTKYISKLSSSFEGYAMIGGAEYKHRLQSITPVLPEKSTLANLTSDIGGEYIWSATNRIRGNIQAGYYNYYTNAPDDRFLSSEIIDDFNITKNVGINIGAGLDANKDQPGVAVPVFLGGFTLKGYSYITFSMQYKYDSVPFKPEDFYFQQKYIMPNYDLPPGRVHHGDARLEVRVNDSVNLKGSLIVERNNRFYNYIPVAGDVLSAKTIPATLYGSKLDSVFMLYEKIVEITLSFEYTYYDAAENITYRPRQNFSNSVQYNGKTWKVEWSNKLIGKVYTNPDSDQQLAGAVIGYFGIQRMLLEGFYAYLKVDNLYNNKYSLREGYPEAGITFLGGLRILI